MFRPVLAIFRLSYGNLRSYYKHAHARGVEISTSLFNDYIMDSYMFRPVLAIFRLS